MGAIYGQKSSFTSDDGDLRLNLEDLIVKYPDFKFPALKRLNAKIFKNEVVSHKYEWKERDLRGIKADLVNATVNDSAVSFIVSLPGVFNKDDIVRNKRTNEHMRVEAITGGTNLTVERAFQGTTAVAMVAGDDIVRIGKATPAGALADSAVTTDPEDLFNYTSIFEDTVEMTDSQHKGFVNGDETQAEAIDRIQQELMEQQHLQLFLGQRYRNAAKKLSTMGGAKFFVDTYAPANVVDFEGAATWSSDTDVINKFEDTVETIATKMGGKPTVYATYKALRKLRLVQDDTVRTTRDDKTRGIGVVDTLQSGMGDLDIVQIIDRTGVLDDMVFFMDEQAVGYKAHKGRGWFTKELPYAGDGHVWQVLGEYTMKVQTPKASLAYIHNLGL